MKRFLVLGLILGTVSCAFADVTGTWVGKVKAPNASPKVGQAPTKWQEQQAQKPNSHTLVLKSDGTFSIEVKKVMSMESKKGTITTGHGGTWKRLGAEVILTPSVADLNGGRVTGEWRLLISAEGSTLFMDYKGKLVPSPKKGDSNAPETPLDLRGVSIRLELVREKSKS
ncbi:MAG: hypothetical protein ABL962_13145 [Fimbriimonadaceae bacterium]